MQSPCHCTHVPEVKKISNPPLKALPNQLAGTGPFNRPWSWSVSLRRQLHGNRSSNLQLSFTAHAAPHSSPSSSSSSCSSSCSAAAATAFFPSPSPAVPTASSPIASTRRAVLLTASSALLQLLPPVGLAPPGCCAPAAARALHSKRSDVPCVLTVRNRSPRPVEARWVNYDGDEEPYATILPGHGWTVDTFETHPWRFRDVRTGTLVCEYIAQRGDRLLQLYDDPSGLLDSDLDPNSSSRNSGGVGGGGGGGRTGPVAETAAIGDGQSGALSDDGGSGGGGGGDGGGADAAGGEWRRRQHDRYPTDAAAPPDQLTTSATPTSPNPQQNLTQQLSSQPLPQQQQQHQQQPVQHPQQQLASDVSERPGRAGGFDGLGNPAEQYTRASLLSVAVVPQEVQAVVVLWLAGFEHPLSLLVGVPEARNIVNAAGAARGRRPTLLATWAQTLQALGGTLERVVLTRQVEGVFYARIVLSQTWRGPGPATGGGGGGGGVPSRGGFPRGSAGSRDGGSGGGVDGGGGPVVSVDARPSDALALALEAGADVFVSLPLAELVQQQYLDAERELTDRLLPPPPREPGTPGAEGGRGRGLLPEGLMGAPSA